MISRFISILFSLVICCIYTTSYGKTGISYHPLAMVNDYPITPVDIENREKFLRIINNIPNNVTLTSQDRYKILNDLIDEKVKATETKRFDIQIDDERLGNAFKSAAVNLSISEDDFAEKLRSQGLSRYYFERVTSNKMAWDELVRGRYGRDITVSTYEIAQIIKANAATDGVSATYNQIKIPFDGSNKQSVQIQDILKKISNKLNAGETFQEVSRSYVNSNMMLTAALTDLDPNLAQALLVLRPNQISNPIKVNDYIILLQLIDKEQGDVSIVTQRMLIKTGRLEFPSNMSLPQKIAYIDELSDTEDLCENYDEYIDDVMIFSNTTISELPKELRAVAKHASEKQIRIVREAKDSDYVLTICDIKEPDYYNDVPLNLRNKVREQVFERKLALKEQKYYRSLKKSAVISMLE